MQESSEKYEGNITIEADVNLRGMVVGSVTVLNSVRLEMHGTITEDLVAESGSIVRVYGTLIGAVINNGADIEIHGVIGSLHETSSIFPAIIFPGAIIGNRTY